MSQEERSTVPVVGVAELRERIEQWRRTRQKRSPMPAELWSEAVSLARSGGACPVARGLGIDFGSLQRRIADGSAGEQQDAAGRFVAPPAPPGQFVAWSGAELLGAAVTANGAQVEVTGGDGARLTVRMTGTGALNVVELVEAFGRRPR